MSELETNQLDQLEALFNVIENPRVAGFAASSAGYNSSSNTSPSVRSMGLAWSVMDARTQIKQAQQRAIPSTSFALGATCMQFFNVYRIFLKTKQLHKITVA